MKRYFFQIAYVGTEYSGWQRQDNSMTVQECIEGTMSKLFKENIEIVGCGRTDAGVHASDYYFHVDLNEDSFRHDELKYKLNRMLPADIAILRVIEVGKDAHARFDATSRAYNYVLLFEKKPFIEPFAYLYNQSGKIDLNRMNEAAECISGYDSFYPFCKSNTDVNNYNCTMLKSFWTEESPSRWVYTVEANRFLRGMVRLIVGMCINYASGKISHSDLVKAMDTQSRLDNAWSVPAKGLSLVKINYPYIDQEIH